MGAGTPLSGKKHVDAILKLQKVLHHRFADFEMHFFSDPFSFNVQDAPPVIQLLPDLQRNYDLKDKFRDVIGKVEKLWPVFRELTPPALSELLPNVPADHVPFWEHMFVPKVVLHLEP